MNVFFYDGPISRAIAFEDLLADGKRFSERLLGAFSDARTWPQLVHIATDGETYGHHRAYGDMALAFALNYIETSQLARLTNYGGISGKASADSGSQSDWKQFMELRARRRTLAQRLRLQLRRPRGLEPAVESAVAAGLRLVARYRRSAVMRLKPRSSFEHPWQTRDAYIDVVLDRSRENVVRFMTEQAKRGLFPRRNRQRPEAARTAALPDADVHQLRMVLRRTFRNRNGPGDSVCRARAATGGTIVHRRPGHSFSRSAGPGQEQHSGTGRWAIDLRALCPTRDGGSGKSRRSLRGQFPV